MESRQQRIFRNRQVGHRALQCVYSPDNLQLDILTEGPVFGFLCIQFRLCVHGTFLQHLANAFRIAAIPQILQTEIIHSRPV